MRFFKYVLKLIDPLFYAREGLSASFTPPFIHATAMNLAVKKALNIDPEEQPFLLAGDKGNRNIPKYRNSLVSDDYYFTPARIISNLRYFTEITKGENDGYIFKTGMGEPFQAGILNYITPETEFEGFLMLREKMGFPEMIRLGSFRGKAKLTLVESKSSSMVKRLVSISHPVDPLVTPVKRGVMINMFPYPVVENVLHDTAVKVLFDKERFPSYLSIPESWELPEDEHIKIGKKAAVI